MAFGSKAAWVRSLPCSVRVHHVGEATVYGAWALSIEAAHVKSRGAGGTAKDLAPLCSRHHAEQHDIGIRTFQAKYDIDLTAIAASLEARWQRIQETK